MPLYIDENDTIIRITLDDSPVGEQPLRESWVRKCVDNLWWIVFGGTAR